MYTASLNDLYTCIQANIFIQKIKVLYKFEAIKVQRYHTKCNKLFN
jgi:hypothetical protein